jgi:hypothetical protein
MKQVYQYPLWSILSYFLSLPSFHCFLFEHLKILDVIDHRTQMLKEEAVKGRKRKEQQ